MLGKFIASCFFGGLIGGLVAPQLGYFWWVGIFVGALVAGISFEFRTIAQAVPLAWNMATSWRPDVGWWKKMGEIFLSSWCASFVLFSYFLFAEILGLKDSPNHQNSVSVFISPISVVVLCCLVSIASFLLLSADEFSEDERNEFVLFFRGVTKYANIFVVTATLVLVALCLIPLIASSIPRMFARLCVFVVTSITTIYRFLKHLFIITYSDARMLVMLFASIGVVVSYVSGSALFGATVGTILGVISFELVSRRWLGLIPMRNPA